MTSTPVAGRPPGSAPAPPAPRVRSGSRLVVPVALDLGLAGGFVVEESFPWTGLAPHEWLGILLGAALLSHVALHGDWVVRTSRRMVARHRRRDGLRWSLDIVLMVAMTVCVASGLAISQSALPALGLHPRGNQLWVWLHWVSANVCLVVVAIHVARNRAWIGATARRLRQSGRAS